MKTCIAVREGWEEGCFLSGECLLILGNKVCDLPNCQSKIQEGIPARDAGNFTLQSR